MEKYKLQKIKFDYIKQIIPIVVIIIPSLIFGIIGKPTEMGLAIIAGSITVAFLNIDKIQRFKGGGFEAEMVKRAVEEAYATIDNLKEMSVPLIVSTLNTIIYSGRWDGLGINQKHNLKDDIEVVVKKLNIDDEKVKEAMEDFYKQHTWDFFRIFTNEVENRTSSTNEKLEAMFNMEGTNYPSKEDILKLNINEGDLSELELEKLEDYLFYKDNHKLSVNISENDEKFHC
ncbi:hypothetical protein KPL47_22560 [Clostridium estertheticum]|uniref:hypothetical protein n=1 Tax=Clostridium estertheticum TaxID=238834 RepID=UPI001C0CB83B|nr:hypothetical protein [Clostridium estertheticum]MBU3179082.1 hypothetical protein [Clostridium estertheticum]